MGQESDGRHLLRCFDSGIPYILYRWIYNYKDLLRQQVCLLMEPLANEFQVTIFYANPQKHQRCRVVGYLSRRISLDMFKTSKLCDSTAVVIEWPKESKEQTKDKIM